MKAFLLLLMLCLVSPPLLAQEEGEKPDRETEQPQAEVDLRETVVVTASGMEQSIGEAAPLVTVISGEELRESPALVLDDQLRQVPGFSLFRRSSSITSHPTTQGVSLRGIGPSGASRSLVLFQGIPMNDPFGGWVYWNRFPLFALGRVEVVRGATSQLYGSSALGGTIQLFPEVPTSRSLAVSLQGGSKDTYDLNFMAADRHGDFAYLAAGRLFDTDGYFVVAEPQRGAVDVPAYVDFQSFFGRVYYRDFHAGLNIFHEDRGNGTRIQTNGSRIYMFEAGLERPRWNLNFYTQSDLLESQFSRVLADRSQEFLTADQRFPSVGTGASFSYLLGGELRLGADWRYASWDENRQNLAGLFIQDLFQLHPRIDLLLGTRLDAWENRDTQTSFNPRAGLVLRASDEFTVRSSLYRGFRAPTLNELYRPFRVGNIVTEANPDLGAENLWGLEGGFDFHPQSRMLFRVNGFWNRLEEPVSNVTISSTPELIQRQRQNLGEVDIRGLELDATIRLRDHWSLQGAYLASSAEVNTTGLRLPQVPLHQATAGLRFDGPLSMTAQARYIGQQFEDDENLLPLGGFFTVDLWLRRVLTESVDLFLALENVLDRQYAVGRTPDERLGQPRLIHGGISFKVWQ